MGRCAQRFNGAPHLPVWRFHDLEPGVFTSESPKSIAESLKRSAEASHRRKASPFQSAMSMLNFYINRAGCSLTEAQKSHLEQAKTEFRRPFGKE
jgi:hypothetical protein